MDSITAMGKILDNLQKKFNLLNQIMNLTKDMENAIKRKDEESLSLVLNMRQKSMDLIDELDKTNSVMTQKLPEPYKERIMEIFRPTGKTVRLENPLETNIFDTNKRNNMLLKRIVQLDEMVNNMYNKA